ncbi:MAG: Fic family protein [Coriobacteriia bacterium]|nr:Fic family protein [Coriobacteriia bacterium]
MESDDFSAAYVGLAGLIERYRDLCARMDGAGVTSLGLTSYEEAFAVKMSYHSNAIEGSTLTIGDTADVLDGLVLPNKSQREQLAAKGVADGMAYVARELGAGRALSEELIKDIHERTALDIDYALRGVYRQSPVYIRGSEMVPPNWESVRELMADLIYQYNASDAGPLYRAIAFHVAFENIHPFQDGNGRTGRNILNFMLVQQGLPPVALRYDKEHSYTNALQAWQVSHDKAPFTEQVVSSLRSELDERIRIMAQELA